ncbi:hypothetical protein PIB30_109645, partial [Stylosanthes scabra]|nr:hypothetical protein [Stylosanthes scabra]
MEEMSVEGLKVDSEKSRRRISPFFTPPNLHSPRRLHLAVACRLAGQPLFVTPIHSSRRQKRGSGGGTGEKERNDSGERRRIGRK